MSALPPLRLKPSLGALTLPRPSTGGGAANSILLNGQPVKLNGQFITLIPATAIFFNAQPVLLNGQFIAKAA